MEIFNWFATLCLTFQVAALVESMQEEREQQVGELQQQHQQEITKLQVCLKPFTVDYSDL